MARCDDVPFPARRPGGGTTHSPELRVGDRGRQAAAERLRAAHDEGRLDLLEYDRRPADAYAAVTCGDLDRLFTDLPPTPSVPAVAAAVAVNVTVWLLVSLGSDGPAYFWPMWLLVPGLLLGIGTGITLNVRNGRR